MRRFALVVLTSCHVVLGGLDEGTARKDPPAIVDAGPCDDWLVGYAYRLPYAIDSTQAVRDYQVPLDLDPSLRGRADLRVTTSDGRTVVPHWIEDDGTHAWARLDLGVGTTRFWIYSGNPIAEATSSLERTFVEAVVDAPSFEPMDPWRSAARGFASPSTSTDYYAMSADAGVLTLEGYRQANRNGADLGVCQTMLFPAGSTYRFEVDVDVLIRDKASVTLCLDGLSANAVWSAAGIGSQVASKDELDPGLHTMCLGTSLGGEDVGQGVKATFTRPRVRRFLQADPHARIAGAVEHRCD